MNLTYEKAEPVKLRELNLDEFWLQQRISDDPSILGLGDLVLIQRERRQPSGGRIDFLMYDPDESGLRYEVEVMLGRLNESHIIRTIEYWDIERQRYPAHQHRAVIVAEDLTTRFLNVVQLLNRAIPIIAIQLSAFRFGDKVVLNFSKLLDLSVEPTADEEEPEGQADREYWERRSSAASLRAADAVISLARSAGPIYNKSHITLASANRKFCWIWTRRRESHVSVKLVVPPETRSGWTERLEKEGIAATSPSRQENRLRLRLTERDAQLARDLLQELLDFSQRHAQANEEETDL